MAASAVLRLQTIVSREVAPTDTAVVTVGAIHAGSAANIIAPDAELLVSIRSFTPEVRDKLLGSIERIVKAEALSSGAPTAPEIVRTGGYPVLHNDPAAMARTVEALGRAIGPGSVVKRPPVMGSEDFGLFAHPDGNPSSSRTVPTGFWFWGGAGEDQVAAAPGDTLLEKIGSLPSNHHPGFMVDPEPTLRSGVEALAVAALAYL
jgi:hippurate hydrolase